MTSAHSGKDFLKCEQTVLHLPFIINWEKRAGLKFSENYHRFKSQSVILAPPVHEEGPHNCGKQEEVSLEPIYMPSMN